MYTKEIEEFNRCIEEISINKNIKNIMEEVSFEMNENEEIKVRYYDFLEETRRLNDSIISDEKRKARREGLEEGREEGREEGMKTGTNQAKKDIVINMYSKGWDINLISEGTNLPIDEIKRIIKK